MRLIKLLILLSVVTLWAWNSKAQTSGGGPTTNHPLSVTDTESTCTPYQLQVATGSLYCMGGKAIISGGGGSGTITGSGSSGEMTYWNGTSSITGNSNFTYDGNNESITSGVTDYTLAALNITATAHNNSGGTEQSPYIEKWNNATQTQVTDWRWEIGTPGDFDGFLMLGQGDFGANFQVAFGPLGGEIIGNDNNLTLQGSAGVVGFENANSGMYTDFGNDLRLKGLNNINMSVGSDPTSVRVANWYANILNLPVQDYINWTTIDNIDPTKNINWTDTSGYTNGYVWTANGGIGEGGYWQPGGSINWQALPQIVQSYNINWNDINRLSTINTTGINWNTVNAANPLNEGGINWNNIPSYATGNYLAATTAGGVNWAAFPSGLTNYWTLAGSTDYTSNLLGWWKLDDVYPPTGNCTGTVLDSSSGGHNGTCSGNPTWITGHTSTQSALSFNGTSQYIDTANIADNLSSMSLTAWIKYTSTGTGMIFGKFGSGGVGSGQGWAFYISSGMLYFLVQQSGGSNYFEQGTTGTFNDGNWHFVSLIFNGTNASIGIYVDGVNQALSGGSHPTPTSWSNATDLFIGTDGQSEYYFPGDIDDARVYNTYLTSTEISNIYSPVANELFNNSGTTVNVNGVLEFNTINGVNWSGISNIGSTNINWANINGLGPINTGGINWSNFVITGIPFFNGNLSPSLLSPTDCSSGQGATGINSSGNSVGCTTYLQGNQTITLTGPVTGSGTTTIATSIANQGIQSAGINWNNINGLNPINMGGVNWNNIPSYATGNYLAATTGGGVNWKVLPSGLTNYWTLTANQDYLSNLVGRWPLDDVYPPTGTCAGTVVDSSGGGHAGSCGGSPSWVTGYNSNVSGLSFNGSSQYINIANIADNLSTFSVTGWVKFTSSGTGIIFGKFGTGGLGTGSGWSLLISTGHLYFCLQQDGSNYWEPGTSSTFNDGNWHFVAAEVNNSFGSIAIYVDGINQSLAGSAHGSPSSWSNSTNLFIGTDSQAEYYFPGSLSDMRVYNSYLTSGQISTIYNPPAGNNLYNNSGTTVNINGILGFNNTNGINWAGISNIGMTNVNWESIPNYLNGNILTATTGNNVDWISIVSPYVQCANEQSSGTDGGSSTSGSWQVYPLNTLVSDTGSITGVNSCTSSFSTAGEFSLPAGTYVVHAALPIYWNTPNADMFFQSQLYNVTASSTIMYGTSIIAHFNGMDSSEINGTFTLTGTTTLALEYYETTSTGSSNSFGVGVGAGTEVYGQIVFEKVK